MRPLTWPDAAAYCAAVLQLDALGDEALRRATAQCLPGGRPKAYSGTFTTTFHFESADGDVALRCFTRASGDIERRYSALAEVDRYVRNDALCRTRYLTRGIRVGDAWWPAVMMEWAFGRPLNEAVEACLHDPDALLELANSFREMVRSLGVLGIAHGDLQHGNILVHDGRLRLIDYDAMFLPALSGLAQSEYGHRNYQHPQRRTARFDGRLDRFSSIVIYTALVALSADPSLWHRFNDGENLLFRAHDFTSNGSSELLRTLLATNASGHLAEALLRACRGPVENVPALEQVIEAGAGTMPAFRPVPPTRAYRLPLREAQSARTATRVPAAAPTPHVKGKDRVAGPLALAALLLVIGAIGGFTIVSWPRGIARRPVTVAHRSKAAVAKRTATVPVTPVATPMPTPATAAFRSASSLQGSWRIEEANLQAGTMVWIADAAVSSNGTMVLDAHKESIGARSATPCERQTDLRATFVAGVPQQTVPYEEVNCMGTAMPGEVRVDSFSPDGKSFAGSFWRDGVKLGDFAAQKL